LASQVLGQAVQPLLQVSQVFGHALSLLQVSQVFGHALSLLQVSQIFGHALSLLLQLTVQRLSQV
jgi:hypothetical protein